MKIVKKLNYFLMAVVFFATVACSSGASTESTVVEETVVEEVEAVVDTTATMAMDSVAVDTTMAE